MRKTLYSFQIEKLIFHLTRHDKKQVSTRTIEHYTISHLEYDRNKLQV